MDEVLDLTCGGFVSKGRLTTHLRGGLMQQTFQN